MKQIAVGELGEFWYGDYKEPFEQLEGGVPGHPVGVVLKADDGKLLCAWCGKTYDNLGRHVSARHGMSARAYKDEVGLLQKSALVSESGRLVRIANGMRLQASGLAPSVRGKKGPRPSQGGLKNPTWRPEALNKTGRCYEQVLAVARSIQGSGRTVTQQSMKSHGIFDATIRVYFGSWDGLRSAISAPKPVLRRKWSNAALLEVFANLAKKLGRTPTQSDLNRYGIPAAHFQRRFGGLAEACRRTGLPPNLPIPKNGDWDVQVLTTYAILGSVLDTAAKLRSGHRAVSTVFAKYGCPYSPYGAVALRRDWAADMARRLAGMAA